MISTLYDVCMMLNNLFETGNDNITLIRDSMKKYEVNVIFTRSNNEHVCVCKIEITSTGDSNGIILFR